MSKFWSITFIFLLLTAFLFLTNSSEIAIAGVILIYLGIIIWGVSHIQSQFFVKSFNKNPKAQGKVAITFDDGPHPVNTPELLRILDAHHAKASFFLIGQHIEQYPDLVKEMHLKGHTLGNHSFSHTTLFPLFSAKKMKTELEQTQQALESVTNKKNRYFRPPFGVVNPTIARTAKALNLQMVGWSIRSFDTKKQKSKEQILNTIVKQLKHGDIILLHDHTEHILWLTDALLSYFKEQNIMSVTIDELQNS